MKPYVRHFHDEEGAFDLLAFHLNGLAERDNTEMFLVYLISKESDSWEFNILGFGSECQLPVTTKLFLPKDNTHTVIRVATDNEVLYKAR
jgi:hypothetical protein